VDVELLVVPECPHEHDAAVLLRTALDDVGLVSTGFRTTVVASPHEAQQRGFIGSPTILLDGADPFAEPDRAPGLACRVYPNLTGLAGVPALRELRRVLKRAVDTSGKDGR
jgi:hypothetical protein